MIESFDCIVSTSNPLNSRLLKHASPKMNAVIRVISKLEKIGENQSLILGADGEESQLIFYFQAIQEDQRRTTIWR